MLTKQCITCKKIKSESEFDFRSDRQKFRGGCKACRRKREKKPEYQVKRRRRQRERYKDPEYREKYNKKRREKLRKTSPEVNFLLRGYHGRFLPGNRINLGRKYSDRIYPDKDCIICGTKFRPINGIQVTCSKECKRQLKKIREEKYSRDNRQHINTRSRTLQQNVHHHWNTQSGKWWWLSDSWKIAEEKSVDILRLEGYDNIQLWTAQAARFPFDISVSKEGKEYLFQVTTNLTAKKDSGAQIRHSLWVES